MPCNRAIQRLRGTSCAILANAVLEHSTSYRSQDSINLHLIVCGLLRLSLCLCRLWRICDHLHQHLLCPNSIAIPIPFLKPYSPVISTSPSCSIAFSIALLLALFCNFCNFLAFLPETGAKGPLVGCRTSLLAVPRGFLETLFAALRFWTFARLAVLRCLLGTLGLPREGIVRYGKS